MGCAWGSGVPGWGRRDFHAPLPLPDRSRSWLLGGGTADSGDTDTDTDTDTDPAVNLGFDIAGDYDGTTLSLTWLDPASLGSEELVFEDVLLTSAVATAHVEVAAPAPDATELIEIDPTTAPGLMAGLYVPALTRDDVCVGVGMVWPVYLSGEIPADRAAAGFTVGGTFGGDPDGMRLVLLSAISLGVGEGPAPLCDGHMSAEWSIPVSGEPPADHRYELDFLGMDAALEIPFSYTDSDHSGDFTAGDALVNAACAGGTPVVLLWMPSPTDLTVAFGLVMQGGMSGWNAILMGGGGPGGLLDEAARTSLLIDDGCVLGGPSVG